MIQKKIALVTGANKGLGFETSREFALKGIKVIMGVRDKSRGDVALKKLSEQGLDVEAIDLDITSSEQIQQASEYIETKYDKLDILVNNAAIISSEEQMFGNSVGTISQNAIRDVFNTNFFGTVELTQLLLPLIKKSKAGRIVNVSSILGSISMHCTPDFDQVKPFAYDCSKTALNQFTVHLASLLKTTPAKVNSAHPGWVKTDLGGDQAPLSVEEGAKTIIELALLKDDGPSGKFFHLGNEIAW